MEEILYLAIGAFEFKLDCFPVELGLPDGVEFLCPVFKKKEDAQKMIDEQLDGKGES